MVVSDSFNFRLPPSPSTGASGGTETVVVVVHTRWYSSELDCSRVGIARTTYKDWNSMKDRDFYGTESLQTLEFYEQ